MAHGARLDGGHRIALSEIDPEEDGGLAHEEARAKTDRLGAELSDLLDLLFYAGQHALLIVLQGRDTSGKDGTIRRLLQYSSAQSCRVEPFKVPTQLELAHDFLWRVHAKTPARGSAVIFNRSHYEDVLVARVHKLVPERVWRARYEHINHFEELLHDSDTIILKFCLHISNKEQEERLLAREEETEKAWKLAVGDWRERELWDEYTAAYDDAINRCARPHAPWYVVPANHKWYRDLMVVSVIVEALAPYRKGWMEALAEVGKKARAELSAYREALGAKDEQHRK